jgi:dual-specificity kinase
MLPYSHQSLNGHGVVSRTNHTIMDSPSLATRKRKRAHQFTVSYSEVQEVDSDGQLREVIVIEDTPPPTISPATTHTNAYSASYQPPLYSAPIRTRARAAAEAALFTGSSSALIPPPVKKRKRDLVDEPRLSAPKRAAHHAQTLTATKSWASGSGPVTDDVRIRLHNPITY